MELRIFSFFSGAGFLDLGFEKEKYEVVFVNEYSNEFLKAPTSSASKTSANRSASGFSVLVCVIALPFRFLLLRGRWRGGWLRFHCPRTSP